MSVKLRQYLRWQLHDGGKGLLYFYGIYLAVMVALHLTVFLSFRVSGAISEEGFTSGGDVASGIYLLVIAIIAFGQGLRVGLANSVTRRTVFCGQTLHALALALVVSAANLLVGFIFGYFTNYIMMADVMFPAYFESTGSFPALLARFLFGTATGFLTISGGLFIGGAYYRMSKLPKILVSVLVPFLLLFGLPGLFAFLPAATKQALTSWYNGVSGFVMRSPLSLSVFCLALSALALLFIWLLLRRAPVKNRVK